MLVCYRGSTGREDIVEIVFSSLNLHKILDLVLVLSIINFEVACILSSEDFLL